jgi:hypothetical protein
MISSKEVVALYLTFKETAATWLGVWSTICLALVVLTRVEEHPNSRTREQANPRTCH